MPGALAPFSLGAHYCEKNPQVGQDDFFFRDITYFRGPFFPTEVYLSPNRLCLRFRPPSTGVKLGSHYSGMEERYACLQVVRYRVLSAYYAFVCSTHSDDETKITGLETLTERLTVEEGPMEAGAVADEGLDPTAEGSTELQPSQSTVHPMAIDELAQGGSTIHGVEVASGSQQS